MGYCNDMTTTLEQFVGECRMILEQLLRDPQFVSAIVKEKTPERQVLYEDPQLGFCVLAHNYKSAKDSPPHDHGPSWAMFNVNVSP